MYTVIFIQKIKIRRPKYNHRTYFDGHHWMYDVGFWVACNCYGVIRVVLGEEPGSVSDITIWNESHLSDNIDELLDDWVEDPICVCD